MSSSTAGRMSSGRPTYLAEGDAAGSASSLALLFGALAASLLDIGAGAVAVTVAAFALLVWLARSLVGPNRTLHVPDRLTTGALAALWAWAGISALSGLAPGLSGLALVAFSVAPLAVLCAMLSPHWPSMWPAVLTGLTALGCVLGAQAAAQHLIAGEEPRSLFLDRHSHTAFLNLVVLLACGAWLAAPCRALRRRVLGVAVGWLAFCIALSAGRGALLGLAVGLVVLGGYTLGRVPVARLAQVGAVTVLAFLVAEGVAVGGVGDSIERLTATAAEVVDAADAELPVEGSARSPAQRLLLWRAGLDLLADAPWHGIGPGLFWLAFAPYRSPLDGTWGQHVHNDYLQIAIEQGWPGLALLLLVLAGVARAALRLRRCEATPARLAQAGGLLAALASLATHSAVSFTLQVPALALVAALCMARLLALCEPGARRQVVLARPAVTGLALVSVVVAFHLCAILLAALADAQATRRMETRDFAGAESALRTAASWSRTDAPSLRLARMLLDLRDTSPDLGPSERARLERHALAALERAVHRNPLRAEAHFLRGRVLEAGGSSGVPAAHYVRALALDPRHLGARRALGELHLARGERGEALRVVNAGLDVPGKGTPAELPLLALGIRLAVADGDERRAQGLLSRAHGVLDRFGMSRATLHGLGLTRALDALSELRG